MLEYTKSLASDSLQDQSHAASDLKQSGEGLWQAAQGLWDAGSGVVKSEFHTVKSGAELAIAGMTFGPESLIDTGKAAADGLRTVVDNEIDKRVEQKWEAKVAGSSQIAPEMQSGHDAQSADSTYTVKAGDNLWKIAAEHLKENNSGPVDNKTILAAVNELKSRYNQTLLPGLVIDFSGDGKKA